MKYELHGMRNTKTYRTWTEMRQRCGNKNSDRYKYYGARGIKVCDDEWKGSFIAFFEDMGERPEKHTLDRIDNSKGYYKDNCRWATHKEQMRNRRFNRIIEYDGKSLCMSEWAEIYGLKPATLWRRLTVGMKPPECFAAVGTISSSNRRGHV